jgi:hypothetical protein
MRGRGGGWDHRPTELLARKDVDGRMVVQLTHPFMVQRALISVLGSPVPDAAQQRVVHLKHRMCRATVRREETHRRVMAIPAAARREGTDGEDEDERTRILLGAKVVQPVKRRIVSSVDRQEQDALLKHTCRSVQVGVADWMRGQR